MMINWQSILARAAAAARRSTFLFLFFSLLSMLLRNVCSQWPKKKDGPLSRPAQSFLSPRAAILDFEGGAGGEQVPQLLLG